ncbi:BgTH12-01190 [Blumeria graminis f. sp. triticale]|uniref:BgtA-20900 n=3 Tax=Blumeria graminis TaxID=34373 RepID=A0A9X9MP30_BLUGR|nr:hypothetical protein BGT96224_A20900 [Blumeria graminis f. sp. tritici 96224]CAD6505700.1 BgTH12-01190 [Blumeria graminis f. sp. triticale]VDB93861.1 BgtA-20900 [Blumeria graminis f. sp. tritici]
MPPPTHLISGIGDPLFAAIIGLAAAGTRINREEKALGHSNQETIDAVRRRISRAIFSESATEIKSQESRN